MAKKKATNRKREIAITPYLTVSNAAAAIEFYTSAFGAKEQARHVCAETGLIEHAEIEIAGSRVCLCDEFPALGILAPLSTGGSSTTLNLNTTDSEAAWQKALSAGAAVLMPLANAPWGQSFGKLVDPFGHYWSVSGPMLAENISEPEATGEEAIVAQYMTAEAA